MSFPRAKRFSEKTSPAPSPADYNVRSPLDKGFTNIYKNARYPDQEYGKDDSEMTCSKMNNTLSKSSLYMDCCKKFKESEINRNDFRKSSNIKTSKACYQEKQSFSKQMKTKNLNNSRRFDCNGSFEIHEEFFDDDYDTFITKEELEELIELEEYEFSEIWKRFQSICSKNTEYSEASDFENTLTTKMDEDCQFSISSTESLKTATKFLTSSSESLMTATESQSTLIKGMKPCVKVHKNCQPNQISKAFVKKTTRPQINKTRKSKTKVHNSNSLDLPKSNDVHMNNLANLIREVMEKLKKEFQKEICKKTEKKLEKLSEMVRAIHMEADGKIEEKCEAALDTLILKIKSASIERVCSEK